MGRTVRTKGGTGRTTAAKPLKPDEKNRVSLRRDGKTIKIAAKDSYASWPLYQLRGGNRTRRNCRNDAKSTARVNDG